MKLNHIILFGCLSVLGVGAIVTQPAQACTPAPDNPNGCDGINGGRPRIPIPRPVCLTCPDGFNVKDTRVILPAEPLNQTPLVQKESLQQDLFDLQHRGVQPPSQGEVGNFQH